RFEGLSGFGGGPKNEVLSVCGAVGVSRLQSEGGWGWRGAGDTPVGDTAANGSVVAAEPQQPPPGKLRKTAFKLFGGKRSICTLPSFFGGRGKKGLSKCKTHDGLSSAACDKAQPDSPSEGSRDGQHGPLPSSRSAQLAADTGTRADLGQQDSSPPGSIEGCDKKPNGEKSFPRPKKGLKGFFNSIRRHRKSKAETGNAPGMGVESRGAVEGRGAGPVPEATACPGGSGADSSCGEATEPTGPTADGGSSEGDAMAVSCLVTYQGGGEEMAIPEEAEEYLQQVWDSSMPGDRSYGAQVSSSSLETHASHDADAHPYMGDAMDGVDLLTPQSDQQESAPNSDEGYYDSTTPGPEDEAGEELKKDRLPRDSYSGDALYEFDALMSPSHGEESLFEGKIPRFPGTLLVPLPHLLSQGKVPSLGSCLPSLAQLLMNIEYSFPGARTGAALCPSHPTPSTQTTGTPCWGHHRDIITSSHP
uniref:APC membrane recruitment protein 1 n=1 Tax=Cyanistes caeruleus TaxID=156563 RepID=A0A8C0ZHZ5_CYACU